MASNVEYETNIIKRLIDIITKLLKGKQGWLKRRMLQIFNSNDCCSFHISGDNLGSYFVSTTAMQYEQRSNPSLAWLMPRPELWDQDQVLVQVKCNAGNQENVNL